MGTREIDEISLASAILERQHTSLEGRFKGDRTLGVVHDSKNHATAGEGFLLRYLKKHPEAREDPDITRAVSLIGQVSKELTDLLEESESKKESRKVTYKMYDLHSDIITPALKLIEGRSVDSKISVDYSRSLREEIKLWCDREKLIRVYTNLFGNALEHGHEGGRISYGAESTQVRNEPWWKLNVYSEGEPILTEKAKQIFHPSHGKNGRGNGLPLVRLEIEQWHFGYVYVEPTNYGNNFVVKIPKDLRNYVPPETLAEE